MTTEASIIDLCAESLRSQVPRAGQLPWHRLNESSKDFWRRRALAVIRTLSEAGCTEAMIEAWDKLPSLPPTPDADLRAMLTALADGAEAGRG